MTQTFILALGTNTNRNMNISKAKSLLNDMFKGKMLFSRIMETEPIGVKSEMYLNLLCTGCTDMAYDELRKRTKDIEIYCGDTTEKRKENIVEMDIDILKFGDNIFHKKDWERDYIKELIKEL